MAPLPPLNPLRQTCAHVVSPPGCFAHAVEPSFQSGRISRVYQPFSGDSTHSSSRIVLVSFCLCEFQQRTQTQLSLLHAKVSNCTTLHDGLHVVSSHKPQVDTKRIIDLPPRFLAFDPFCGSRAVSYVCRRFLRSANFEHLQDLQHAVNGSVPPLLQHFWIHPLSSSCKDTWYC